MFGRIFLVIMIGLFVSVFWLSIWMYQPVQILNRLVYVQDQYGICYAISGKHFTSVPCDKIGEKVIQGEVGGGKNGR